MSKAFGLVNTCVRLVCCNGVTIVIRIETNLSESHQIFFHLRIHSAVSGDMPTPISWKYGVAAKFPKIWQLALSHSYRLQRSWKYHCSNDTQKDTCWSTPVTKTHVRPQKNVAAGRKAIAFRPIKMKSGTYRNGSEFKVCKLVWTLVAWVWTVGPDFHKNLSHINPKHPLVHYGSLVTLARWRPSQWAVPIISLSCSSSLQAWSPCACL